MGGCRRVLRRRSLGVWKLRGLGESLTRVESDLGPRPICCMDCVGDRCIACLGVSRVSYIDSIDQRYFLEKLSEMIDYGSAHIWTFA